MSHFMKATLCLLALTLLRVNAFSQSGSPLQGVWKTAEVTTTGADATTNKSPQPGYYLFTGRHYSIVTINSDKPRPNLPQDANTATAAQLRDVWGPLTAQTGTYEVKGSEVILRPLVAKNPNAMATGNFNTQSFKIEGKTLTLVTKANQAGPVANPVTRRLTRVE